MITIKEMHFVDKQSWGDGPWLAEPDKLHWIDEATDMDCLAVRNGDMGNWCGYVAVNPGHPWYGKDYNDLPDYGPEVHGGLTFANKCHEKEDGTGICHVPQPGRPHDVWWFGFDCAHCYDLVPGTVARMRMHIPGYGDHDVYRDLPYVQAQCADLARQLKAATDEN